MNNALKAHLGAGVSGVINKPIIPEELVRGIANIVILLDAEKQDFAVQVCLAPSEVDNG